MKKRKFITSVVTVGLLLALLGTTCFAEEITDDKTGTEVSEQQDGAQLERSGKASEVQSDEDNSGENDSQKEKGRGKKKHGRHFYGAGIAESIAALEDGEAKTKAQAAYDAYDIQVTDELRCSFSSQKARSQLKPIVADMGRSSLSPTSLVLAAATIRE